MALSPVPGCAPEAGRPAVFLDKDGTLVEDVPYNVDPALLRFTPRAVEALRLLAGHGYALVVVTNQPGIALGRFDAVALRRLQSALTARLADAGVHLAGFHACPHAPAGADGRLQCECRKPAPGLLRQAARTHGLDLGRSWMVGDILHDIEAGRRAGCRTVLLDVGHETEWEMSPLRTPHRCVRDLMEAARAILASDGSGRGPAERGEDGATPASTLLAGFARLPGGRATPADAAH